MKMYDVTDMKMYSFPDYSSKFSNIPRNSNKQFYMCITYDEINKMSNVIEKIKADMDTLKLKPNIHYEGVYAHVN